MSDKTPKKSLVQEFREILTAETAALFVASFITPAAAFMLYPFLTIYFTHALGLGIALAGLLLSLRFLSGAVLGFLGGMLSDRFGLVRTYVLAGIVTALAIFLMGFQHNIAWLAVLLVVWGSPPRPSTPTCAGWPTWGSNPNIAARCKITCIG